MKIFLFWDDEEEEIWYYVSDGKQGEPFLIKPCSKKVERAQDKSGRLKKDGSNHVH